mmetsp:Transcript_42538/g.85119  ORF Transcript_42538/g.85119 Transcript_42538/m.85119 type:complete len:359 (+) Transcript_42538:36-1112(+)
MAAMMPPFPQQQPQQDYYSLRLQYQRKVLEEWRNPQVTEVERWTKEMVGIWLEFNGFAKHISSKFENNDIDGSILLRLEESHVKNITMRQHFFGTGYCDEETNAHLAKSVVFADTLEVWKAVELIQRLCKKMKTRHLQVPSWISRFTQLGTFQWADTSEGKSISDLKNEVTSAAGSVAMVSTLVWAMCWDIFYNSSVDTFCLTSDPTQCYSSGGFDLAGTPLSVFYFSAGICSMCFLFSTLLAVFQMIMVNEMSDEEEIDQFFDLLTMDAQLPGILLFVGMVCFSVPVGVYLIYNVGLGLHPGPPTTTMTVFSWMVTMFTLLISIYGFLYKLPQMIKGVYKAKMDAAWIDRQPPNHFY